MTQILQGHLNAEGKKIAIVVSRFNELICKQLLEGALDCLKRHGASEADIVVARVPGAFEIPAVAKAMIDSKKYDGLICLGAVIRGQTPHFDYIAAETTKGIGQLAVHSGTPVAYGVITADTLEQAFERAGTKAGNKGWDAALSAIEMVNLMESLK